MEGKGSTAVASARSKRNALSLRGRTIDRVSDALNQKHDPTTSPLEEGIPTPPVESPIESGTDIVFAQPDPKESTKRASGRLSLRNKNAPTDLKVIIPPTPPPSAYPTPSLSDSSAKILTSRTRTPPTRQGVTVKKSEGSATSLKRGEKKETPKKAKGKKKENSDTCGSCGGYGQLVCCDECPAAHHLNCLPSADQVYILQANVDDPWYCTDCAESKQGGSVNKNPTETEKKPTPKTHVPSFTSSAKHGKSMEIEAKNTGISDEKENEESDSENEFDEAPKPKTGAKNSRRAPAARKTRGGASAAIKIEEKRVEKDGNESDEESDGDDGNVLNDDDMVYGLRNPAEPESDPEEAGRHGIEYAPPPPSTNKNEDGEEGDKVDPWADDREGGNGGGVSDGEAANAAKKGIPVRKGGKRRATPKERQDSKKPKAEDGADDAARPVKSRVSGPRSALTSFLEEKGISARDIRLKYFQRLRQHEEAEGDAPPASDPENGDTPASGSGRGGRNKRKKEEQEEEEAQDSGSDLKLSDSDDDIKKAKSRAKAKGKPTNDKKQPTGKGKGKKGKKGAGSDPGSEADEDDNRPALLCISCGRQLPRNILMSDIDPTHPQCGVCIAAVEKRRMGHSKKQRKSQAKGAVLAELHRQIPSLQNMCIKMISNHITDVESFGDVPANVMEAICRIICRHRQLTVDTLQLFLENEPERIIFPDCAKLNSDCYKKIAFSCPTLTTLRLEECGRITDEDISLFASQCPNIKVLILQGPYLISDDALADAISKFPNLEEFEVGWSPKVGPKTLQALGKVPKLKTAGFTRCSRLTTDMLLPLVSANAVKKLILKEANVSDDLFEALLPAVGGSLTHIDVTGCKALTDVFVQLVAQHCPNLEGLTVEGLKSLTDQAVILLASGCPKITHLNLRGCIELTDESVRPLLTAYGKKIVELTLACLEMLSPAVFEQIADSCHFCLVKLDVSWCRCVEDEVLERIIRSCKRLTQVSIWGCHRVTESSWRKGPRSLSVLGGMHI